MGRCTRGRIQVITVFLVPQMVEIPGAALPTEMTRLMAAPQPMVMGLPMGMGPLTVALRRRMMKLALMAAPKVEAPKVGDIPHPGEVGLGGYITPKVVRFLIKREDSFPLGECLVQVEAGQGQDSLVLAAVVMVAL